MGRPRKNLDDDIAMVQDMPMDDTLQQFPSSMQLDPLQNMPFGGMSDSIPWTLDSETMGLNPLTSWSPGNVSIAMDSTTSDMSNENNSAISRQNSAGSCGCIVTTTTALLQLQSLTTFHFPSSLGFLRNIMASLKPVAQCSICPLQSSSLLQNSLLLRTCFASIAERFQGLLAGLEERYQQLQSTNSTAQIRFADPSVPLTQHTGTPDCPHGFTADLDATQWRALAHRSLLGLMKGPGDTLESLVKTVEQRPDGWHVEVSGHKDSEIHKCPRCVHQILDQISS